MVLSGILVKGANGVQEEGAPIVALSRDLRAASETMTSDEARFLVDAYYLWQEQRIRAASQVRALLKHDEDGQEAEPHAVLDWLGVNTSRIESNIQAALDHYTNAHDLGRWARSIVGIGPVIAAGLLAHIDIEKAPTAGHIWRFAGLDPTTVWEKKTKRPWNATLKTLCWKIGESFVKFQNNERDVYGKVYVARKSLEVERNEAGLFAEQAASIIAAKNIGHETDAYKAYSQGKLPPAHIHARAKRYAVKLFLAHYQHVAYELHYHKLPPRPYVLEHLGHVDYIAPPNWPMA